MKTAEALAHFGGSARKLADSLGISVQAVHAWGEEVPELRAYQLEVLTDGALKVNGARPPRDDAA